MKDVNMQHAEFQNLLEASWRRPLTPAERERLSHFLAAHAQLRPSWDREAALSRLLQRLPNAPISSNFTARVLQAAQRAPARNAWLRRLQFFPWLPAGWMPRAGLAAAMVCCAAFTSHEYQVAHRAHVAREIANVSRLAALPSIDWLKDFDTISRLNKVKVADDELLSALQ
jgi:anti-sigma factor RsiW